MSEKNSEKNKDSFSLFMKKQMSEKSTKNNLNKKSDVKNPDSKKDKSDKKSDQENEKTDVDQEEMTEEEQKPKEGDKIKPTIRWSTTRSNS